MNAAARLKVLVLGDSCAYGWGLADFHHAYSSRLERLLETSAQVERGYVEVYNAAVPGYTAYQGLQNYIHHLRREGPWDFVILSFGWNDILPDEPSDAVFMRRNPPAQGPASRVRLWAQGLRFFNVLTDRIEGSQPVPAPMDDIEKHLGYYRILMGLARADGSTVIVLPSLSSPLGPRRRHFRALIQAYNDRVAAAAATLPGVHWLDMRPEWDANPDASDWVDRVHYGPRGHERIAVALAALFERRHWWPKARRGPRARGV